jgi:integrase
LRGLEWTDYSGDALSVKRSVWKTVVNQSKTRASAKPVPVIRQLAEILDTYRSSIGDPQSGVMFHTGAGEHLDIDKLVLRFVRPVAKGLDIDWYGLHGFRRGIASNLYELGADEKSSNASCVMQSRMSRLTATSRRLTRRWSRR